MCHDQVSWILLDCILTHIGGWSHHQGTMLLLRWLVFSQTICSSRGELHVNIFTANMRIPKNVGDHTPSKPIFHRFWMMNIYQLFGWMETYQGLDPHQYMARLYRGRGCSHGFAVILDIFRWVLSFRHVADCQVHRLPQVEHIGSDITNISNIDGSMGLPNFIATVAKCNMKHDPLAADQ